MATGPNVCVQTDRFSAVVEGNAFRPGREFASWVASALRARGESTDEIFPEDWGWCVPLQQAPYRLWVGCGIRDGTPDEWVAFAAAESGILNRLFGRNNSASRISELTALLRDALGSVPGVTRVWVEENGA
jgi:hypothetical protein